MLLAQAPIILTHFAYKRKWCFAFQQFQQLTNLRYNTPTHERNKKFQLVTKSNQLIFFATNFPHFIAYI